MGLTTYPIKRELSNRTREEIDKLGGEGQFGIAVAIEAMTIIEEIERFTLVAAVFFTGYGRHSEQLPA